LRFDHGATPGSAGASTARPKSRCARTRETRTLTETTRPTSRSRSTTGHTMLRAADPRARRERNVVERQQRQSAASGAWWRLLAADLFDREPPRKRRQRATREPPRKRRQRATRKRCVDEERRIAGQRKRIGESSSGDFPTIFRRGRRHRDLCGEWRRLLDTYAQQIQTRYLGLRNRSPFADCEAAEIRGSCHVYRHMLSRNAYRESPPRTSAKSHCEALRRPGDSNDGTFSTKRHIYVRR